MTRSIGRCKCSSVTWTMVSTVLWEQPRISTSPAAVCKVNEISGRPMCFGSFSWGGVRVEVPDLLGACKHQVRTGRDLQV